MRHTKNIRVRTFIQFALLVALVTASQAVAAQTFDKSEFAARRAKLFEQMADGVGVVFADEPHVHAVKFRQAPDFYYLTGVEEPGAFLLLVGPTKQAYVFAHKKPGWKISVEGPGLLDAANPAETYGLTAVQEMKAFIGLFNDAAKKAAKLYVPLSPPDMLQMGRHEMQMQETEMGAHPLARPVPTYKQAVARLRELHPKLPAVDINPLLDRLRWVKSPYEVARMRESGRVGAEAMKAAIRGTAPGMFEYEIEAAARFVQTKLGARGDAFTPIVASGPNTITWHYSANNRKMEAGDVVLMDYGADYDYYTSDITRTWPVSGAFTPEQEKMYRCVLDARNSIIAAMKPGVTTAQLQSVAEEVYKRHGFHKEFLALGRYVGHPVGLSVHDVEPPGNPTVLQAGVVFNVEPLLEMRDKRIHVRLEDSVLVTPAGAENLTAGVPADIASIYALIKEKGIGMN